MNNVQLLGRLVKDADFQKGAKGKKSYCKFTLAVPRGKDETDFINCIAFEKTAELISEYVKKGNRLLAEGSINVSKYTNKEGKDAYQTNIIINRINFIDYKDSTPEESTQKELPF